MMFSTRFEDPNPFIRVDIYFFDDLVFFYPEMLRSFGKGLSHLNRDADLWTVFRTYFEEVIMLHGHPVKMNTDSVSSMTTNSTTADKLIREMFNTKLYAGI